MSVPLGTIARTLGRLRFSQIALRPWARVAPAIVARLSYPSSSSGVLRRLEAWSRIIAPWTARAAVADAKNALRGSWTYAGVEVVAPRAPLHGPFPSRLWAYELHYRRYIEGLSRLVAEQELSGDQFGEWWRESEESSPPGSRPGWEAYVLARRLWSEAAAIGALAPSNAGGFDPMISSLGRKVAALRRMPEVHLLANHLLADRATVAAMELLLRPESRGSRAALDALRRELKSQVDRDGMHIERSPVYHLNALLDLRRVNAACHVASIEAADLIAREQQMADVLRCLLNPDASLPMFHDSPAVTSPSAADLEMAPDLTEGGRALAASGLIMWRGPLSGLQAGLTLDFGEPRPTYQPGHQHAAPFSFELWWGGPFITAAGVTTYAAGDRRFFERGGAAHASVRVNGRDAAEIWSSFRMGRGFHVSERVIESGERTLRVQAEQDGFRRVLHRRTIELRADDATIDVTDELKGPGVELAEFFYPLADGWSAHREDGDRQVLVSNGARRAHITVRGARLEVRSFHVARSFGLPRASHCIVAVADTALVPINVRISMATST